MSIPHSIPHQANPHSSGQSMPLEFLVFKLDSEEYGIDIQQVQEIRGYDTVTRIANSPEHLKGVVNLRGVIVPIVDLRMKFKLGTPSYDQFTVVIILNLPQGVTGIVVDGVADVVTLAPDQLRPVPEVGTGLSTRHMTGMGVVDDRMLILIDIEQMMREEDLQLLDLLTT